MSRKENKNLIRVQQREKKILSCWNNYKKNKEDKNYLIECTERLKGLKNYCSEENCFHLLSDNFKFLNPEYNWEADKNIHISNLINSEEFNSVLLGLTLHMTNTIEFKEKNNT